MTRIHEQHGMTAKSRRVSISIFGILILVILASCNNTGTETGTETGKGTAPAGLTDLAVKEGSITVESVELTWNQPTDFGTTDGTTAAVFGSYAVKVYEGADESGTEVPDPTLTPSSLDESTVSVRVSGLSSGTQYAFKLVLSNDNDSPLSSDSNVVSATTVAAGTAPAVLTDLSVTEASTTTESVELTWSRPTDFGTAYGTTPARFGSYAVKVYEGANESGTEVPSPTLTPSSLDESTVSVRVSGLSSGTQYAFKLVLSNDNDSPLSSDSNVVSATTVAAGTAPAVLTDLSVTEASTTTESVELTWSRPTDFGTAYGTTPALFGSYAVKVYEGADESGTEVPSPTLTPSSLDESTVSVRVSGLSSGTQYAFKLVLSNDNDSPLSSDSNVVSATTVAAGTAPAVLTDLSVTEASTTTESVELTWSRPTDFGTAYGTTPALFGSYEVKVYEGADESGTEVPSPTLTPSSLDESTVSVKVSGLSPGTQYAFKLVLSNDNDSPLSSDSNVVSATTVTAGTAPAVLTDLSVTEASITADTVDLTWSRPTDFGTAYGTTPALFGSYEVKVYEGADDSGTEVPSPTLTPSSLDESTVSVKVSGLSPGTQYAFKLVLSNDNDSPLSSDSNVVSATTVTAGTAPAVLTDLSVTEASITADTVDLTWSRPTDFGTAYGTTPALFGSYEVKVYEGADDSGTEVPSPTLTPSSLDESTVSVKVSGLSSLTQYAFKLVLSNDNDPSLSSDSNVVSATTAKAGTAPAVLTDLSVTEASTTTESVELTWSRPTDFGTAYGTTPALFGSYEFKVYEGADDSGTEVPSPTLTPSSLDESTVSVKVSGLDSLTQYAFKLVLSNDNDPSLSSDSNVVSATTQDPKGRIWNEVSVDDDNWFSVRQSLAEAVFDGKLWIIGGLDGSTRVNDVWSSLDGKVWTEVVTNDADAARFSGRSGHAVVVFDNKLWLIGGSDGSTYKNDVWSSPDGKVWTEETKNVTSTRFAGLGFYAAVVFEGKIWVIGGYDGDSRVNDVWSSSDGKVWTEETKNVTSTRFSVRNSHAAVVFNNKLWVIGGDDGTTGGLKDDVWSSPDGKVWTKETPDVTSTRFSARSGHTAVVYDGKIWVIGGKPGLRTNDVWSSLDGKSWTEVVTNDVNAARFSGRYNHATMVFDNKIWVIGGEQLVTTTARTNDVWYSP